MSRPARGRSSEPKRSSARVHGTTAVVACVGVLVTAGLTLATWYVRGANEDRLLDQRVNEAAAVLKSATPTIETPLAAAAVLAEATDGDAAAFRQLVGAFVGPQRPFTSASMWSAAALGVGGPLVLVGDQPKVAASGANRVAGVMRRALRAPGLSVFGLLNDASPRLGYSYVTNVSARYVVYAEAALPPDRTSVVREDSAFEGLGYALYLGSRVSDKSLLLASTSELPLRGRTDAITVPLGDSRLRLVMTPTEQLGGSLLAALPWIILAAGLAVTTSSSVLTERLLRRRDDAETLASDNERLYSEQRDVAHILQMSLLPEELPRIPGLEFAARYLAGGESVEIGGDWYDVVELPDGQLLLVIGDVSGRGITAATIMARLRYSIRAYAADGDPPGVILDKVSQLIEIRRDAHFATVLCAQLNPHEGTVCIANAGHPPMLLVGRDTAAFVDTALGVPLGVDPRGPYQASVIELPAAGTLLLYTDGLFERRGETLDTGQERLRARAANGAGETLDADVSLLLSDMTDGDGSDDTAILGVRWMTTTD